MRQGTVGDSLVKDPCSAARRADPLCWFPVELLMGPGSVVLQVLNGFSSISR